MDTDAQNEQERADRNPSAREQPDRQPAERGRWFTSGMGSIAAYPPGEA
ncbi:hypothetical protein [Streptomyces sp. NBC_01014]|nr:hypothetical protein OG282_24865 [Streptomyces sp. NBC_01014]